MADEYIVVHGVENRNDCPRGRVAFEADEQIAARVRQNPTCLACGGVLVVKSRDVSGLTFSEAPVGVGCAVCKVTFPLAQVPRGWLKVWLCPMHANWFDQPPAPPKPALPPAVPIPQGELPQDEDPRKLIEPYLREGIRIENKGCCIIEGYENLGPAFVIEIRDLKGKLQISMVSAREAIGKTPEEFQKIRFAAVLDGIRKLVNAEAKT